MNNQEYEQKLQEHWEDLHSLGDSKPSAKECFDYAFAAAYALGKQEKDAEGEEMLTVSAITVREMYAANERIKTDVPDKELGRTSDHINHVLRCLFSSKCLPDLREQKPTEPKFKVGDKVECLHNHHIYVIRHLDFYDGIWRYNYGNPAIWIKESDLEPYTEPEKESRNLSKNIVNCDKQLDNILKDSFSKERRLNIATQMVKAIMQCPEIVERIASAEADSLLDDILHDALHLTDRLIAECEKGGSK